MGMTFPCSVTIFVEKIKCNNCLLSFQWKTSLTVNLPYFEILSSGKAMVTHQSALEEQGVFLRPSYSERALMERKIKYISGSESLWGGGG